MVFADPHGILRGKTVVAEALPPVLASGLGVPSTLLLKDLSHRTVFPVWSGNAGLASNPLGGAGDVLLVPQPETLTPVPWSPHSAWMQCRPVYTNLTEIPFEPQNVLAKAMAKLADAGMAFVCGLEIEFHIFRVTDAARDHGSATMPPRPPNTELIADGYKYLTESVYDAAEPVLDEIRRAAQAMGLPIASVEVEMGPGQFEVTFSPGPAEVQARHLVLFRTMVKELCARNGLHATFMTRPAVENCASSGWHVHQSVVDLKSEINLFEPKEGEELSKAAEGWLAGLLAHAGESCLMTTPTVNGYKRYQPFMLAPDRIQWGRDNRGAMLRVLAWPGNSASRIENRVAEPAANPYYCLASQMLGGLRGIAEGLEAPPPVERPYEDEAETLPANLGDAIGLFEGGSLYRDALGEEFVSFLARLKRAEWERYLCVVSHWEQAEYFTNF
ncbi:glutamine synthetase family protein [Salaquimonas pukyongi]|uniref:glutamine synthetase family protein n=1 Tax=Salaquimonas pukyongi TaxID=2712698 RepID=UPI001FCD9E98|nr:glutamine synthetase family protein [Salaquimonas pukyongi]